jgi:glycerol-3-phosphate acyltransferase PlsY
VLLGELVAIEFASLVLAAYLLGSVPAAYLVARWVRGIDIRKYGSGNVGASNVTTIVGRRWAIPVIVFDLVKGALAIWVAQWIGLSVAQQVAVGLAAIIGHNWPVFLRFSGGRGGMTIIGVALILMPKLALILVAIVFSFSLIRQLALGTILVITILPVCSWFFSQPMDGTEPLPLTLGFMAVFVMTVIRRLAVRRSAISASVSKKELVVNRLLFDRDIRDKKAWIHRTPN